MNKMQESLQWSWFQLKNETFFSVNSSQIYKLNIKRQEEKKEEKYSIFEASKESGEVLCNYNTDISIPEI